MCLAALLLCACSAGTATQNRANGQAQHDDARETTTGGRGSSGYVEYTVEDVLLRREEAVLDIEEARFQRTERAGLQEVIVRTVLKVPADYENCLLLREATWRDLERSFADDDLPDKQVFEQPWGRRTLREEFVVGDEIVVVFRGRAGPDAGTAGEAPLYALCYSEVASDAGGRRTTYYDVSRVEVTLGTLRGP